MKRVLVLGMVLAGLLAGTAQGGRNDERVVKLMGSSSVRTWHSKAQYNPTRTIKIGVYVLGFPLWEHSDRECELEWIGKGVAVRASLCGSQKESLTFQYVSFAGTTPIRIRYSQIR